MKLPKHTCIHHSIGDHWARITIEWSANVPGTAPIPWNEAAEQLADEALAKVAMSARDIVLATMGKKSGKDHQ